MSGEKIQVREGWWRQRCGEKVWVDRSTGTLYPWYSITPAGELGPWRIPYTNEDCQTIGETTPRDLVEYLGYDTITAAE